MAIKVPESIEEIVILDGKKIGTAGLKLVKKQEEDKYSFIEAYFKLFSDGSEYRERYDLDRTGLFYRRGDLRAENIIDDLRGQMLKKGLSFPAKALTEAFNKLLTSYYPE